MTVPMPFPLLTACGLLAYLLLLFLLQRLRIFFLFLLGVLVSHPSFSRALHDGIAFIPSNTYVEFTST